MTDGSMEVYYDLLKGWRINIDKRGYETISAEVVEAIETRVKERIIKLLENDKRLHSYSYAKQFIKAGASVLPFVEVHAKDCPGCDLIALIKGEQIDHLGEAIRATAWAYTEGEQPNPLIKGEK